MAESPRKLRPAREYDALFYQAAVDFVDTVRMFVPVIDDPACIKRLPGYPIADMWFPFLFGYRFSICIREEFADQFDWAGKDDRDAPADRVVPAGQEDDMLAHEWVIGLFEVLATRWKWLPIYRRSPVVFPDDATELAAFLRQSERYHDLYEGADPDTEALPGSGEGPDPGADEASPEEVRNARGCGLIENWLLMMLSEVGWEVLKPTLTADDAAALQEVERRLSAEIDPAPPGSPDGPSRRPAAGDAVKRERRFKRGHLDEMALSVAALHPDWTNQVVAEHLGCHVKTLSNRDLCPRFNRQRDRQQRSRGGLKGGHYDARTERFDQVSEDDT